MEITNINADNYAQVADIYRQGIATGIATFQDDVPDWASWDASHLQSCRFAAFEQGEMLGWVALSPVSSRCVYGGVAEVSIYVAATARGKGVGQALLRHLIEASEVAGLWTLQSGIFAENIHSIALHEKCGFRIVGVRERIGQKNGVWKNTVLMERRSDTVGAV